jgi:WD40 repeat protein
MRQLMRVAADFLMSYRHKIWWLCLSLAITLGITVAIITTNWQGPSIVAQETAIHAIPPDVALGKVGLEMPTQLVRLKLEIPAISHLAFSADGKQLFTAGMRGQVTVWDLRARTCIFKSDRMMAGFLRGFAVSPDGRYVVTAGDDHDMRVYDIVDRKELKVIDRGMVEVWSLAFTPDGRTLVVGEGHVFEGKRGNISLWDASTRTLKETWKKCHDATVDELVITADGKLLISRAVYGSVKVWELSSGKLVHNYKLPGRHISLVPGKDLEIVRLFYNLEFFNLKTGQKRAEFSFESGFEGGNGAKFKFTLCEWLTVSPDGRLAAIGGVFIHSTQPWQAPAFRIIDVETGRDVGGILADPKLVRTTRAGVFSPDGKLLAVGFFEYGRAGENLLDSPGEAYVDIWEVAKLMTAPEADAKPAQDK